MTKRASHKWTPQDEAAIRDLVDRGFYLRRIALRLRRSESSIKVRAHILHIKIKPTPRYRMKFDTRANGYRDAHN